MLLYGIVVISPTIKYCKPTAGVTGRGAITGHEVVKKNKTYFGVDDVKFDMDVVHATIHMDNLFNGNKALGASKPDDSVVTITAMLVIPLTYRQQSVAGDTMNRFMSDNWNAVYSELKPVINEAVSSIFRDGIKKIFDKFSLDDLFPM